MKFQLDESLFNNYKQLNEDINDGWDDSLEDAAILYDLEKLIYEIKNGRKGVYTRAHTYAELADHIENLAADLEAFADQVRMHEEDPDEDEEE